MQVAIGLFPGFTVLDASEQDPQPPFDTGTPSKMSPEVKALADHFASRTDGGRRRAIRPDGRKYDYVTTN